MLDSDDMLRFELWKYTAKLPANGMPKGLHELIACLQPDAMTLDMLAPFVVVFFVSPVHGSKEAEFRVGEHGFQGQPRQSTRRRRVPAY